jgi:hypothetical protein
VHKEVKIWLTPVLPCEVLSHPSGLPLNRTLQKCGTAVANDPHFRSDSEVHNPPIRKVALFVFFRRRCVLSLGTYSSRLPDCCMGPLLNTPTLVPAWTECHSPFKIICHSFTSKCKANLQSMCKFPIARPRKAWRSTLRTFEK